MPPPTPLIPPPTPLVPPALPPSFPLTETPPPQFAQPESVAMRQTTASVEVERNRTVTVKLPGEARLEAKDLYRLSAATVPQHRDMLLQLTERE